MRGAAVHQVKGVFPVLFGCARFLVAADEKYRVVRSGGDDQQREQIGRVRRQPQDPGISQKRDESPCRGHLDQDGDQDQQRGGDRSIDEKQHHRDHPDGYRGDFAGAFAALGELIGDKRCRAGDIGLDAFRRLHMVHSGANSVDGLVG